MVLRSAPRYQHWVLDAFGKEHLRGDVVEVGAGNGNFTRWLAPEARHVTVAEPDVEMCAEIEALGLSGVEVLPARVEALQGARAFDAVAMFNVLEHIEDDVEALRATRGVLREGGVLLLLVPAHPLLYGTFDRRYGHHRRYTKRAVAEALTKAGYTVERCRYFNPIGALGWFAVSKILRRPRLSRLSVRIAERVAVPVGRLLERLGDPPFGQSVLAVARKP